MRSGSQFHASLGERRGESWAGSPISAEGDTDPSAEAVAISIDRDSSEHLRILDNPDKWYGAVHARLIDGLIHVDAKVITCDGHFLGARAAVLRNVGN